MKLITIAFIAMLSIGSSMPLKNDVSITIYILDPRIDFSIPPDKVSFWANKEHFDTIEIIGQRLNNKIRGELALLQDTSSEAMFHSAAFILRNYKQTDTLYSDPNFRWWVKGTKSYFLNSNFFKENFYWTTK